MVNENKIKRRTDFKRNPKKIAFISKVPPKRKKETLRAKPKRYKLNFDLIYGKRRR